MNGRVLQMGLCRNILYHGCSTPPCIGKSKTAENIGEGGLPVEIFAAAFVLKRKEREA